MPFNGSGTFTRVRNWVNDAAANIRIRADYHDSEDDNFANGLSQCITKDGQTTVTANLPMATYKHTNVGAATARTHYARYDQLQDGVTNWADAGGTADAITATYNPPITTLVDGQLCFVRAGAANATTTPTFAPDGLTARTIVKYGGSALSAGDIVADGHELILRYDLTNTRWELLNPQFDFTGDYDFSGKIRFPDDGELTIATGAITVTGVFHTIDTESDAATDDLDTISGGSDGQILIVRAENDARTVVIKNNTGNILSGDGNDITLDEDDKISMFIYDGAQSKWLCIAKPIILGSDNITNDSTVTGSTVSDALDTLKAADPVASQLVSAWVNFDGTSSFSINGSYNVSGGSRTGVGDYSVSWDNDFADTNYAYFIMSGADRITGITKAVGSLAFTTTGTGGTGVDYDDVSVLAIGLLA